jgi:hypothetical protein
LTTATIAARSIAKDFNLTSGFSQGLVTAATLGGILIGATALGGLADVRAGAFG